MKNIIKIKTVTCIALIFLFNALCCPLQAQQKTKCPYRASFNKCFDLSTCYDKITLNGTPMSCRDRWMKAMDISLKEAGNDPAGPTLALQKNTKSREVVGHDSFPRHYLDEPLDEINANRPWHEKKDFYFDLESLVRGIATPPLF
jgi:hypothetical protein